MRSARVLFTRPPRIASPHRAALHSGARWRVLISLCLVSVWGALGVFSSTAEAAAQPFGTSGALSSAVIAQPFGAFSSAATSQAGVNLAGTWSIVFTSPPCVQGCGDTWTFTQTAANTYTIGNAELFFVTNVAISTSGSGASVGTCWTSPSRDNADCPGGDAPGADYFIVPMTFSYPAGGPNTVQGTVSEYTSDGTPVAGEQGLPYTGTQVSCTGGCSSTYTVSGTVTSKVCGASGCTHPGDRGVTVLVTGTDSDGNAVSRTAASAADGSWSLTVPAGSYTAGPSQDGTTFGPPGFDPSSQAVTVGTQDVTGVDFVAPSYKISGELTNNNCGCSGGPSPERDHCGCGAGPSPAPDVKVDVTGDGGVTTSATSDSAEGVNWSVEVPDGSYTVTPDDSTYSWSPDSQSVKVDGADVDHVDFDTCGTEEDKGDLGDAVAAAETTQPCRPTAVNMVCSYQRKSFVSFTKITAQSCFVTVRDLGPAPHQNPEGSVTFTPPGDVDENPCVLSDTISTGVTDCQVSLEPGFFSSVKVGDTLRQRVRYIPENRMFLTSNGIFAFRYTPMLDQSNKDAAARIETNLGWATAGLAGAGKGLAVAGAIPTPASPIEESAAGVSYAFAGLAGTTALVMHELQTPDEPPDPRYASVFRPRIATAHVTGIALRPLRVATRRFEQSGLAIAGWAGAEWNALNRSIIARDRNNRVAFVTQMRAASIDETKLAILLSSLKVEFSAVERLSPPAEGRLSTPDTASALRSVKKWGATQDAAQKRLDRSVGLDPAAIADLLRQAARNLPRSYAVGNVFARLKAAVAAEAGYAPFLRKVAAIHAAMASLYS